MGGLEDAVADLDKFGVGLEEVGMGLEGGVYFGVGVGFEEVGVGFENVGVGVLSSLTLIDIRGFSMARGGGGDLT